MMVILTGVKWYLVVVLIYISLMADDAEHSFICLWTLYVSSLEKCLSKSFAHYLIGLLVFSRVESCEFLIYFGDQPLSNVSLANMFSHTVGSLFILMMFSLAMQKLFKFDITPFVYSFLYFLCPRGCQQQYCCVGYLKFYCLCFPSRTFMVSQLMFKSFIHLEFIFVYGVSWWLSFFFFFFACSCPNVPTPFVEEAIFTPFYPSAPLSNIN